MRQPLLVTNDSQLRTEILRLAAAADVVADLADTAELVRDRYDDSSLVLVGDDLAEMVATLALPRHPALVLVTEREPDYRTALAIGAAQVLRLPQGEAWLRTALADSGDGQQRAGVLVGLVSAGGGPGASTLAAALALRAAQDWAVALVDLDPWGAGLEQVLAPSATDPLAPGVGWAELGRTTGRMGSQALRDSLPRSDEVAVLGWGDTAPQPLETPAVREVLTALRRGHDLVVVDLPRAPSDFAEWATQSCDHLYLLATTSLSGAAAARRVMSRLPLVRAALVARTTHGAVSSHDLADAVGLRLAAELERCRRLPEQLDLGLGPIGVKRKGPASTAIALIADLRASRD